MTNSVHDPATTPAAPDLRASDADRERVCRVLHDAAGAGMLTLAETEERLDLVYAARFRHELDRLTADLPAPGRGGQAGVVAAFRVFLSVVLNAVGPAASRAVTFARRHRVITTVLILGLLALAGLAVAGVAADVMGLEQHPRGGFDER